MHDNNKPEIKDGISFTLGRQLTVEYYKCESEKLLDQTSLEKYFLKAAHESGATIISSSFHTFKPHGVSGVIIIAESHITVHAWPEHNYAAVDIFTCGNSVDINKAVESIKESIESKEVVISSDINRGLINNPSEQFMH